MKGLDSVMTPDRKLAATELIRAVRLMVTAEYDAVRQYTQLAESTDDKRAQAILNDIANEEKIHAGEFLRLLNELSPGEQGLYNQGGREAAELIEGVS
jgi:rubrerythrin